MSAAVFVLACLCCQGLGRRMQTSAAFNPSGAEVRSPVGNPTHASLDAKVNRLARDSPLMQETLEDAPAKRTLEKKEPAEPVFDVTKMPGVTPPLGFFDPLGYSMGTPENKMLFYREVELKHGRVAMLAATGFLVAEQFHPLFGGNIDVPSLVAFQETPLQSYWGIAVGVPVAIAIPEVFSIFTFEEPGTGAWCMKTDRVPGDLGFDPLGLKPKDPKEFLQMQNKEINNGRLAMIAFLGMVYQEVANPGSKLF